MPAPDRIVLCVEDEVLVRLFIEDALTDAGFRVLTVPSPDEALIVLQARPDVLVLVTDVEMGSDMDGFALARAARQQAVNLQIIAISGRTWPQQDDLPSGCTFLGKPVSAKKLVEEVTRAAACAEGLTGPAIIIGNEEEERPGGAANLNA